MAKPKKTEDKPRRFIDSANARRLAVKADVDPATIKRALNGDAVRGMAGERARRVLIEAGLLKPEAA